MTTTRMRPGDYESYLQGRLAAVHSRREDARAARADRRRHIPRRGPRRGRTSMFGALFAILALMVGAVSVLADGGTYDVQVADKTGYAAQQTTEHAIVEYIGDSNISFGSAGTGTFGTFLQTQNTPSEWGYNTDGTKEGDTGSSPTFNHAMLVSDIPTVTCESLDGNLSAAGLCWELFADINDSNANDPSAAHIQLTDLEIWLTGNKNITNYPFTTAPNVGTKVYDFAGNILINDVNQGSGRGDLRYLIPVSDIDLSTLAPNCGYKDPACATYFVDYTAWGDTNAGTYSSDSGFEEWKVKTYPYVTVAKTATTTFTRTWEWSIDKSVDPDSWSLFDGDTGTSDYGVTVTKTGHTDSGWAVTGTITIDNPGKMDAPIDSVTDVVSGPVNATVDCGVTFPYTLPSGDTLDCTYSASLPDGTNRTNTATVTLVDGPSFVGHADVTFGDPTTTVNGTVNVTDSKEGSLGSTSATHEFTYDHQFDCSSVSYTNGHGSYTYNNTATITETGQHASASVTVDCYKLDVSKDATTSFTRTYQWSILKSSDDPNGHAITLNPGETYVDYPYSVTVDMTGYTDSDFAVSGSITITNPNPDRDADLTSVVDSMTGGISATVDCPSLTVPAGDSLVCTYSADLPDGTTRTNTATATQQNYDFASDLTPTESGTTDYSGTASVDFTSATMTEVDETITVTDTYAGTLGTVTFGVDTLPKTFTYNRTFGPYTDQECGDHLISNTASFVTNDTATTGDSSWDVTITVPCPTGCTLTQGYWKTHNANFWGGAPEDPTWDLLPGGLGPDTVFFNSGHTWFEVFWTNPKGGNAYYILAHQYEAAVLNILSGADSTTEVDAAIAWAETFFNTYNPDSNLSKTVRQQAIYYAGILGSYNTGLIGPGHCSEDSLSTLTIAPTGSSLGLILPIALPGVLALRRRRQR